MSTTLYAYSTLKPGDMNASGVPAVAFTAMFTNNGASSADVSLLLTMPLASVNDCARPALDNQTVDKLYAATAAACLSACGSNPSCASWTLSPTGNCTLAATVPWSVYSSGSTCGVAGTWSSSGGSVLTFSQKPNGGAGGPAYGDVTLKAIVSSGVTASTGVASNITSLLASFANTGSVSGANAMGTVGGATVGVTVPAGTATSVSIVFAWYFPERDYVNVNIGNFYSNLYTSSVDVANVLGSADALTSTVETINAHHAVFVPATNNVLPVCVCVLRAFVSSSLFVCVAACLLSSYSLWHPSLAVT